jgi:hypothetical protein
LRSGAKYKGGPWQHEDYDVFDGHRCVGRIFLDANHTWFWGVSFQLTGRKSYGHAATLDEAKAAFRNEYGTWRAEPPSKVNAGRAWSPADLARLRDDLAYGAQIEDIAKFLHRDVEEVKAKAAELRDQSPP